MDLIFCKLKKYQKHESNFLQALKAQKYMNLAFCKLTKAQKYMNFIFCKLKKAQKTLIEFVNA